MTDRLKDSFTNIYVKNLWGGKESVSGPGSSLGATAVVRQELPEVFKRFKIKSFLDIPCGDFNWMQHVDMTGIDYIGADIVSEIVEKNKIKFPELDFRVLDLTQNTLPKVDIIFVRDCLGHLSFNNARKAIQNVRRSGSKYLLTTSYTASNFNTDINNGSWYPINLTLDPFNLVPIYSINENRQEGNQSDRSWNSSKCLLLFDIEKIL